MQREPSKSVIRVMGVDPGFATMGIAVLEQQLGCSPVVRWLGASTTTKQNPRKALVETRVSVDDQRRLSELWGALSDAIATVGYCPAVLAVEAYRPFSGRGGGNAWKSAVGYGLVSGFARAQGCCCMVFLPDDLKRAFTLSRSSTKQAVEDAVCLKIPGLRGSLDALPSALREHAADAAGHAYLALVELAKHGALLTRAQVIQMQRLGVS